MHGAGDRSADRKTGLLERQIQTWGNTGEQFRCLIIKRIRTALQARIAQERGKWVERMVGYSNDNEELRREFGIDLEPEISESPASGLVDLGEHEQLKQYLHQWVDLGRVDQALSREHVGTPLRARRADLEDREENCFISTL